MNYGPYVKNLRQTAGLWQEVIAQKLKISRPTYILTEKGERELGIDEVKKLTGIFGLPWKIFLTCSIRRKLRLKKSS